MKDCNICNRYQAEQLKLPLMQPNVPTRSLEKSESDIFGFKGLKYLMIADISISAETICNHLISVLSEYSLPQL